MTEQTPYTEAERQADEKRVLVGGITLWIVAGYDLVSGLVGGHLKIGIGTAVLYGTLAALLQFRKSKAAAIVAVVLLVLAVLGSTVAVAFSVAAGHVRVRWIVSLVLSVAFLFLVGRSLEALGRLSAHPGGGRPV